MTDAERYEQRHPQTSVGVDQAAERQQRHDLARGRGRVSVLVPRLPWLEDGDR